MSFKDMFRKKYLKSWLLAVFGIETLCATYCLKIPNYSPIISILYFAAGICMSFLIILFPQVNSGGFQPVRLNKISTYFKFALIIMMVIMAYYICRYWFDLIPIDADYADMLPVINAMDQRLVAGHWKHIYDPISEIWNGTSPIYLPAMWLPFTPAIIFDFDMRWITSGCLLFSFSAFLLVLNFNKNRILISIAMAIAFILFWWVFAQDDSHGLVSMSEEGVVILYYVLLALAIGSGNIVLIGLAASLCMLSRYSLIGWIPAFLFYLISDKKKKSLILFIMTGIISFLVIFIIPFGWHAFTQLLKLPGSYIEFAKKVWSDSPEIFWLSLGLAKFFGPGKTALSHTTLIALTFIVPLLFVIFCLYRRKKNKLSNIPLATLKLSLVIFYNFIDVPYLYLFYTSSFISLITVAFLIQEDQVSYT